MGSSGEDAVLAAMLRASGEAKAAHKPRSVCRMQDREYTIH